MNTLPFDRRPIVIAIAGPNGAGKSTFYQTHLAYLGLPFINPDDLARELDTDPYEAAQLAGTFRNALLARQESFIFETVFSDPVGDKVSFLRDAAARGYTVVLLFIGLADVDTSANRVAQRVAEGGHDVPLEKLEARFARTLANLQRAVHELPHVVLFDNTASERPFRAVATFDHGALVEVHNPLPAWARDIGRRP